MRKTLLLILFIIFLSPYVFSGDDLIFYDNFQQDNTGNLNVTTPSIGFIRENEFDGVINISNNSLLVIDPDGEKLSVRFIPTKNITNGTYFINYKVRVASVANFGWSSLEPNNCSNPYNFHADDCPARARIGSFIIRANFSKLAFKYRNSAGSTTDLCLMDFNITHHVVAKINMSEDTADFFVDGESCGETQNTDPINILTNVELLTGSVEEEVSYWDDVCVYNETEGDEQSSCGEVFGTQIDNCTDYSEVAATFEFRDLMNESVTVDHESNLAYVSDVTSVPRNFSFSEKQVTAFELCVFPADSRVFSNTLILYMNSSTSYEWNAFNYTFDPSNPKLIYLYVTGGTNRITITVIDTNDDPVRDAYIYIEQFSPGENVYKTVEILKTDAQGQGTANLILFDAFYRFNIIQGGKVRLLFPETQGQRILSTSLNFQLNLDEDLVWYDNFDTVTGTDNSLTYNNATSSFVFSWIDTSGNIHQGCLRVVKNNLTHNEVLSDTCTTSTSATIVFGVPPVTAGNRYVATGYFAFDLEYIAAVLEIFEDLSAKIFNADTTGISLFFGFLFIVGFTLAGLPFPLLTMGLNAIGIILSWLLGLYIVSVSMVFSLIIMSLIYIMRAKK